MNSINVFVKQKRKINAGRTGSESRGWSAFIAQVGRKENYPQARQAESGTGYARQ